MCIFIYVYIDCTYISSDLSSTILCSSAKEARMLVVLTVYHCLFNKQATTV